MTAEHHVLDPVGEGPTGGGARLDADAERRVAVGDHGLGEAEELIERGGDLVAVGLKTRRLVPDERLEVGLVGHAVLRAVDVAEAHGAGGPVLADRCGDIVGQRHDEAVASEVGELAGLREDRDVRRGAGFDLHVDLGLPVGGTDVEDGHVVGLSERVECAHQAGDLVRRADRTGDADSGARKRVGVLTSRRGGLGGLGGSLCFRGLGLGSFDGVFGSGERGLGLSKSVAVAAVSRVVVGATGGSDERQGEQRNEQLQQGAFHWFPSG